MDLMQQEPTVPAQPSQMQAAPLDKNLAPCNGRVSVAEMMARTQAAMVCSKNKKKEALEMEGATASKVDTEMAEGSEMGIDTPKSKGKAKASPEGSEMGIDTPPKSKGKAKASPGPIAGKAKAKVKAKAKANATSSASKDKFQKRRRIGSGYLEVENTRNQVVCRLDKGGPGSTKTISFNASSGKDLTTAVNEGVKWLKLKA